MQGKKLIYITTAGGFIKDNLGFDYVYALAKNFYGINDVQLVKAEGPDVYGADVSSTIENAKNEF